MEDCVVRNEDGSLNIRFSIYHRGGIYTYCFSEKEFDELRASITMLERQLRKEEFKYDEDKQLKQYIKDKVPVTIVHSNELGNKIFGVVVVDSDDFWLGGFTEFSNAIKFCKDNELPIKMY